MGEVVALLRSVDGGATARTSVEIVTLPVTRVDAPITTVKLKFHPALTPTLVSLPCPARRRVSPAHLILLSVDVFVSALIEFRVAVTEVGEPGVATFPPEHGGPVIEYSFASY